MFPSDASDKPFPHIEAVDLYIAFEASFNARSLFIMFEVSPPPPASAFVLSESCAYVACGTLARSVPSWGLPTRRCAACTHVTLLRQRFPLEKVVGWSQDQPIPPDQPK